MNRVMVFGVFAVLVLASVSFAETTCEKKDCEITIKLKLAFQGADNDYINKAKNEIESVWNGPNGYRTTGDCKCIMTFEVETTTAQDCKNNPPAGYHCIMVTNFFKPDGTYDNPPRNQQNIQGATTYIGYMYGVSSGNGGNSEKGWWSDIMSRPVNANQPQGEHYKDFAHEAGHMMGLEDGDGGIMSRTSGANSGPTQANIDEIANDICGADACPKRCCCGNGQVDGNVGEKCDPFAEPVGCGTGQSCCAVCCNCFGPICEPANGEFLTESECKNRCGADSTCYKNYKTGCWDCLKQNVVVEETCYDSKNIRGNEDCDHLERSFVEKGVEFYGNDLVDTPVLGGMFANERINIQTAEGETGHITTQDAVVSDYGEELLGDPTVTVYTDDETIGLIGANEMTVQQAIAEQRIRFEGNGLLEGLKFWFYGLVFDIYNFANPAPGFEAPEEEEDYPQEYFDDMGEAFDAGPAADDPRPSDIGELPDDGYFGQEIYPEMEQE